MPADPKEEMKRRRTYEDGDQEEGRRERDHHVRPYNPRIKAGAPYLGRYPNVGIIVINLLRTAAVCTRYRVARG